MAAGRYTVVGEAQTISTAITIIEVTAPSTAVLKLIRAWANQHSVTTSAGFRIQLLRKTGTITGTASPPTPRPNSHFYVPPSGIIALKFPAAPTSASWTFGMEWDEFGS
jgi:hypothetical protein